MAAQCSGLPHACSIGHGKLRYAAQSVRPVLLTFVLHALTSGAVGRSSEGMGRGSYNPATLLLTSCDDRPCFQLPHFCRVTSTARRIQGNTARNEAASGQGRPTDRQTGIPWSGEWRVSGQWAWLLRTCSRPHGTALQPCSPGPSRAASCEWLLTCSICSICYIGYVVQQGVASVASNLHRRHSTFTIRHIYATAPRQCMF